MGKGSFESVLLLILGRINLLGFLGFEFLDFSRSPKSRRIHKRRVSVFRVLLVWEEKRMGKQGDLWDDSALVNAFDAAISKYKVSSDDTSPSFSEFIYV